MVAVCALALALSGCGDDGGGGGDDELVDLLQDEGGLPEEVAVCTAEQLGDVDIDQDELESIVRGEGSDDVDAADEFAGAVLECADFSDLLSS